MSNHVTQGEAAIRADKAEYTAMLGDVDARQNFFGNLTTVGPNDHKAVKDVKNKIALLLKQEMEEMGFKHQLTQEEQTALEEDTYAEVATKSNFYFSLDENKKSKNLKIYDFEAPGNKFKNPNVILPHEHCDIQNYLETKDLTEDKLFEIYAYYSLLIDMHIAQVRPGIVDEVSYVPPHMNQTALSFRNNLDLNNMFFEHYHRWREPTREAYAVELKFQETLRNQPTTDHYDHGKGTKYDVEWSDDQKFPHVATRLGFPTLREEPIERILGFERAPANPGYQFQPFVQTPPMEPDAALNFEEGEVIYENKRVAEWVKFWKACAITVFGMSPGFYIFEIYKGDGAPSLQWMSDNWNSFDIPRQFQDGSGWGLEGVRYCDDHDYMNIQYGAKRSIVRPSHTMYVVTVMALIYNMDFDYVTKMRYNKEKDLVFVTRPDRFWGESESVYEMHHLEQMVPAAVTAMKNMSANDHNGILTVHDMAEKDYLKLYKEDKYWNLDLRDEFMAETRGLWENTHADKYTGRLFQTRGLASKDMQITMSKV